MTKKQSEGTSAAPGSISGTVDARQFAARLRLLDRHSDRCNTIPILNCCTIEFDPLGFEMKLSHYGLDMTMQATLAAEGSGAVCVPIRILLAFVAAADGATLAMEKNPEDSFVTFKCGRYTAKIVPLPVADVPRLETPDIFARGFALGEGVLAHLFALSVPFVSAEETRYYLNGVAFECETNKVRVVATDGHKLGTRAAATPAPLEAWNYTAIVPNFAISAIAAIIGKSQVTVRLNAILKKGQLRTVQGPHGPKEEKDPDQWMHQVAQFDCDGWCITTKLIDGKFPDWRRVVPKIPVDAVDVSIKAADVGRFAKMVKGFKNGARAVKVSPLEATGVRLAFRDMDQIGNKVFDDGTVIGEAAADVGGEFQPFGVNAFYFATVTKALGTEWVNFTRADNEPYAPLLLRPKDGAEDDFAVLMPMRV